MPALEGHLTLRLYRYADAPVRVQVISSRPQFADRLFRAKTPAETAKLAGQVFTLCGRAQHLAAAAACAAAQSNHPDLSAKIFLSEQLRQAVLVETVLEHAWRLLLDWPAQAGLPPDMNSLRELRQAATKGPETLADVLDVVLEHQMGPWCSSAWVRRGDPQGQGGSIHPGGEALLPLMSGGEALLPLMSTLSPAETDALAWQALEDPHFCTRPLWRGQPAETGALARQQQHPLLADLLIERERRIDARWLARCLELAELPSQLRRAPTDLLLARSLAENRGYAWVETARGALLHVVHLVRDRVLDYRIIAPTEWNFHPAGPFAAGIAALGETADLAAAARALALSLDPCVSYQVEVVDA
ncbi:MAG: nickel-dependent hydrogenase large subunit [Gammaproteobacteria bacterium]|nr:nickel-dependent hydrogenase large subunit [Gammaproteobacteria bacterium]